MVKMELLDSEERIQLEANENFKELKLSKYKHIETKIAGALLKNEDGSERQAIIVELV